VFYFSVHQSPFYPGTGGAAERGEGKAAEAAHVLRTAGARLLVTVTDFPGAGYIGMLAGDPDLMSQTTNFGGLLSTRSLADPDDNNFVAASFSSPLFTAAATSGVEPTLGLGAPGQTILRFQSPVAPFLNGSIALPVTDPLAPLFTALLPLGL